MEWISVKDKLPETVNILVAYEYGVMEAKYFQGKFLKNLQFEIPGVTHWMPLPEPPKE